MKLGYVLISLVIITSCYGMQYHPCYFNPLCSCSKTIPDLGIVVCKDIVLPSIPQTINTSKVFMLHLENNQLRHLEPFFLQNTGLYKLIVKRNPIPFILAEAFLGLERSLWELDLSHNQLSEVPNRALRHLQKLRILDLSNNEIAQIAAENWRGLETSLETLILSDNAIDHLPTGAFGGLHLLETLDLRGNNLRQINPAVFREGMDKLAHLLLGNNQLTVVPYQAVHVLNALKTLELSENVIRDLQPEIEAQNSLQNLNFMLSVDVLRLDYNQIEGLVPGSFQYFDVVNKTYLDGNPIQKVEEHAFRQAKIRELSLRSCGLSEISPFAFDGLEDYLQLLDISANNITMMPPEIFHRMTNLRQLSLADNMIATMYPIELFHAFQYTLMKLDVSGMQNTETNIQDLRRLRNLRFLSMSKLPRLKLQPDDFIEFDMNLEEIQINYAGLQTIANNAFQYVHTIRRLDFNENAISEIENEAFVDSLVAIPVDCFRPLVNLEQLDISHNRIANIPDTSFHFLKSLRWLELQDNNIEELSKGTFQGDIHSKLEYISLSFNYIRSLQQHTFADLASLEHLHVDDNMIENIERRSFMNLAKLKRLNLKGNKIRTISYEAFQNLPELEDLDMSFNEMKTFEFTMFDQVGTLAMFCVNVSHNHLTDLNSENIARTFTDNRGAIGSHSNIKLLDMSHNSIKVITKNYYKPVMLSLTQLYLHHNLLHNASRDIFGNLPHLQLLDLRHNRLFEVDLDTFRNSKRLQVFYMSHNYIPEVPKELFKFLLNLRIVDFSHSRLRFLPDNLFCDEGLEWLDLSHNQITRLPLTSLTAPAASTLHFMDLSWNGISSVVSGSLFQRFKRLTRLNLSHNRLLLIEIAAFGSLPQLTSLDLSHNGQLNLERNWKSFDGVSDTLLELNLDNVSLTYVPDLPLSHLFALSLAHNALPTVPSDMAVKMSSLRSLNLGNNDLTAIPIVVHSLTHLRRLYLANNPITSFTNISLSGVAGHLEVLDIRGLDLNTFENGVLCEMFALKTLKMNSYPNVKNFNIPNILRRNSALRNLEIDVDHDSDLRNEMHGSFPPKLRNLVLSGSGLRSLTSDLLHGIRHPNLHFSLRNTSLSKVQVGIFENMPRVRNISVDLRNNRELRHVENPSTGSRPNQARRSFLKDLSISANKLSCDCQLGWIEVWLRKRRQYLCSGSPFGLSPANPSECRHVIDDFRITPCANKNNASLVDVMKADLECGWSRAPTFAPNLFFLCILGLGIAFNQCR